MKFFVLALCLTACAAAEQPEDPCERYHGFPTKEAVCRAVEELKKPEVQEHIAYSFVEFCKKITKERIQWEHDHPVRAVLLDVFGMILSLAILSFMCMFIVFTFLTLIDKDPFRAGLWRDLPDPTPPKLHGVEN